MLPPGQRLVPLGRALPGYRGQSRLSSWLCGIARRKVADFCRRRGWAAGPVSLVPPERLLDLMDSGPLPDAVLQQSAARARMVEALAGLPAKFSTAPVMVLILVNMLGIPAASLVIVLRRKYV